MATEKNDPDTSYIAIDNVCISDVESGQIIFQRVFKWRETSAFANLGFLVQGLYQFAREVDDGAISAINFEANRTSATGRIKKFDVFKANQSMQMMTERTNEIIVSMFFDLNDKLAPNNKDKKKLKVFLNSLKAAFENNYILKLREMRGLLQVYSNDLATGAMSKIDPHAITKPFEGFKVVTDVLKQQMFPNPRHDPPLYQTHMNRSSSSSTGGYSHNTYKMGVDNAGGNNVVQDSCDSSLILTDQALIDSAMSLEDVEANFVGIAHTNFHSK